MPLHRSIRRCGCLAVLSIASLLSIGCGGSAPYSIVPISGKVSYEDGTLVPAQRIGVEFVPQVAPIDTKTHPRHGNAEVDVTTGAFDLATTQEYGDGVIAGRHRVLITAYGGDNLPSDEIPDVYRDPRHSPLEVDTANSPFELRVKLP